MFKIDLITLFAAFGSFQGILFSIILWFRKKAKLSDKIFSLLLFATSIRIAKNIVVHAYELDPDLAISARLWWTLIHVGLSHQFAIGPLFMLYFLSRSEAKFELKRSHFLHFLPFIILLILTPFLEWPFWRDAGLWVSYISILAYYLYSFWVYIRTRKQWPNLDSLPWLRALLIICGILLLAYSPALFKYVGYLGGAVLYAIGIYFVTGMVLGRDRFFTYFQNKYPGTSLNQEQTGELLEQLKIKMIKEEAYLHSNLSLSVLAADLNTSSNNLSRVINSNYKMNFTDFVNGYRIDKAKGILKDPEQADLKIAAVAFDCGFNSLSTFNTVFKKMEGMAPNQFRLENNPAKS